MQIFVETHYYDGGFKSCLLPGLSRPDFLPQSDLVGLRSTEVELADGDFALELAQFRNGRHLVCWIGCYTRGFDRLHGDRGNYCGVGVWLVDATLIHSLHLVTFLRDAAVKMADGSVKSPMIRRKLEVFASQFADLGWCAPLKPSTAQGRASASISSHGSQSSYLILPDNYKESFDLAGIDILSYFRAKLGSEGYSRRVYFLAPKSRVLARPTEQLAYKNALTYAEHIIHLVNSEASCAVGIHNGRLLPEISAVAV